MRTTLSAKGKPPHMKSMKFLLLGGLMAASAATTFAGPGVQYWQSRGRNGVIPNYSKASTEKAKACDQCCQKADGPSAMPTATPSATPAATPAATKEKAPRKA